MNILPDHARLAFTRLSKGLNSLLKEVREPLPPPGPLADIKHAAQGSPPRYFRRHSARVVSYLQSGKPLPRRARRERMRIVRMGRKMGMV